MPSASYLLDTNVLVYATLAADPRHARAKALLLGAGATPRPSVFVSAQNLAEMWPTLTGPRTDPPDAPGIAAAKIESVASLPHVTVLSVDRDTVRIALRLAAGRAVTRQRYFDVQVAAVMLQNGVRRLYTENLADFRDIDGIEAVNPFV